MGALCTYERKLEVALGVSGVVVDGLEVLGRCRCRPSLFRKLYILTSRQASEGHTLLPLCPLPNCHPSAALRTAHLFYPPFLADIVAAAHHLIPWGKG